MPKFLDKKEQVYELELTPFGRHKLAKGTFKPTYYGFYDDNVVYDRRYMGTPAFGATGRPRAIEPQNDVNDRIKEDTQYMGSQVLFRDIDSQSNIQVDTDGTWESDTSPIDVEVEADIFRMDELIGHVNFSSNDNKQAAPAWKAVALSGEITSISSSAPHKAGLASGHLSPSDAVLYKNIPQINMKARYSLELTDTTAADYISTETDTIAGQVAHTPVFADGNMVTLKAEIPLLYIEEMNTELLTENFDIEIFDVAKETYKDSDGNEASRDILTRKIFRTITEQIQDGFMVSARPEKGNISESTLTSESVEYFFDIQTDALVDRERACKSAAIYNKDSYYIDMDLDCDNVEDLERAYYDIYGNVTEAPVCLD